MVRRFLTAVCAWAALAAAAAPLAAQAQDDATLLRVFLKDGTSLVSFGEPARTGDRVVFSMPTAATPDPPLQLVNLPLDRVDWDHTERYANAARATHYLRTQAEYDYSALSNGLADTLSQVAAASQPTERLAIVERARKTLAEWPQAHFNYRQAEVRQMIGMLDEAIADLKAASGAQRFELTFSAFADAPPAPVREPLLPRPTLLESIQQVLSASRVVDSAADRVALLNSALASVERDKDRLPSDFVATTRANIQAALRVETQIDGAYSALSKSVITAANRRAIAGDVRGLERLATSVRQRDIALGGKRPETVAALVAAVQERLDAARRLRLARDRWELRVPVFTRYTEAMGTPMTLFDRLAPLLEAIKALSGSSPASLTTLEHLTSQIIRLTAAVHPPEELNAAHALLVSAVQLAANAGAMRRQATLANDMNIAWNASSAAAGALMLASRARSDMEAQLRPPQLR